jgi:outer membrane protein assembly factor BamA
VVAGVRSLVVLIAIAIAAGWLGIRHLPARAEADVVAPVRRGEVQSVALDGRGLPMTLLRGVLATQPGQLVDSENLARDRAALAAALADRGYLAARVEPARIVDGKAGAFVTFAIDPGVQFRVRSVTVAGAAQRDAGVITLAAGEIFAADRIARARDALAARLAARGKQSVVEARLVPDHAAGAVDVELVASR